jgi:5,8-dihydroxy-2-naphthoate synthase
VTHAAVPAGDRGGFLDQAICGTLLGAMKITVAHSPDSDDAFMFYGLASGAVAVDGIEVDQVLSDIQTLNQAAFEGRYEVTAVSFNAYAHLVDRYALLPHGASMGDKYGPLLVSRRPLSMPPGRSHPLKGLTVAIPGKLTSAFLTLQMFDPSFDYEVVPFDEIGGAVLSGRVDAGLLIHEGQLTYAAEGLHKIVDLGEWWFERTGGLPLPLGGNVIRRDLGPALMGRVSKMLHDSIAHALSHRAEAVAYAQQFGRGLNRADTDTFVGMYVNQLTLDYGPRGRAALERFFAEAFEKSLIPQRVPVEFV